MADPTITLGGNDVGVQAGIVYGDVNYEIAPEDPPEKKYEVGVRYLDGGMAHRAKALIVEAIAKDHDSSEVRFHSLLALLSGRTFRQFSGDDLHEIDGIRHSSHVRTADAWGRAAQVIFRLFDALSGQGDDPTLLADFEELEPIPREKILRHLDLFLKGAVGNQIWNLELEQATQSLKDGGRAKRVWMFFVPPPARPRVRQPAPVTTSTANRIMVTSAAVMFTLAVGYIGWLVLRSGSISGILAYLLSVAGGWVAAVNCLDRCTLADRLRAKEAEHHPPQRAEPDSEDAKFPRGVRRLFDYYFAKYVPKHTDRDVWMARTAGIRETLRREVTDCYRGTRDSSDQVRWLIRHHVSDVRARWEKNELWEYRSQFGPQRRVDVHLAIGCAALLLGGAWSVRVMTAPPFVEAVAVTVMMLSGWRAAVGWLRIALEKKRYAAEQTESDQRMEAAEDALRKWEETLADKPSDVEMAAWLDADQKLMMNNAMEHYKLTRDDVFAHAFISGPSQGRKRRRVRGGPFRYSRYRVHVFLLTASGVRQVVFSLNFQDGSFRITERTNYRYEAVAAVQVKEADQELELQLVSGLKIPMRLAEPDANDELDTQEDGDPSSPFDMDLAPASLANTIHVLEGIAAEGVEWINRERLKSSASKTSFTATV